MLFRGIWYSDRGGGGSSKNYHFHIFSIVYFKMLTHTPARGDLYLKLDIILVKEKNHVIRVVVVVVFF